MSASASFQIDPGTAVYGAANTAADAAALATVNCRLVSTSGVSTIEWSIFGTHGVAAPTITLSGNPTGQIASFDMAAGLAQAYGIRCKVNGGAGTTGDAATTQTSAVYVLDTGGNRPFFIGETYESDSTYGVVIRLNKALSSQATIPASITDKSIASWNGTDGSLASSSQVLIPTNGAISLGASPATTGALRLSNNTGVYHRGSGAFDLACIQINASDQVVVGANDANQGNVIVHAPTGNTISLLTANTTRVTVLDAQTLFDVPIAFGADPSGTGQIRLENTDAIKWRGSGAFDLAGLQIDGSNNIGLGANDANQGDVLVYAPTGQLITLSVAGAPVLGAAAAIITCYQPLVLMSSTVAGLPAATTAGQMIHCTDEVGGAVPVFSDGTNWRRVTDRVVAS